MAEGSNESLRRVDAYRDALRSRLASSASSLEEFRAAPLDRRELLALDQRFMGRLWDEGWKRWGWPQSQGGLGGGVRHRAVLYDELTLAGFRVPEPDLPLEVMADPTTHFAPQIADELMPACYRGEEIWAQGFSEPDAGSDLASLRTRATHDGDDYVVSGQKIWTSNGFAARRLFTLVRTGTPESRHRGISALLIDADAPGVTVRPLTFASGALEMAECFFDEVRVPVSRLIGPENGGWGVAMYLLQYERGMYAWIRQAHLLGRLRKIAAEAGATDTASCDVIGRSYHAVTALRARSLETVRRLDAGETVGPDASVDKVLLATAEQSVLDAARDLLRGEFDLADDAEHWRREWWYSRAASIYGGSGEVQRGILADRVLGLPPEVKA